MKHKISIGIVGLGQFGSQFIKPFKEHPYVKRIAICDIHKERVNKYSKKFRITETYTNFNDICNSDLDALAIITQPWLHAPQVIHALKCGKHVYSAVPVMMSKTGDGDEILDWCDKLIDTVKRTGQYYMMGETTYFRPETVYCRKMYKKGLFGHIVSIDTEYLHDTFSGHLIEVYMARTGKTRQEVIKEGGNAPFHYPTHSFSAPISITGAHVTKLSALGYIYPNDNYFRKDSVTKNIFCNELALCRLSNGAMITVREYRRCQRTENEGITRVIGTKSELLREYSGWKLITKDDVKDVDVSQYRDPLPEPLDSELGGHGGSHSYLVHEFVDSCSSDRIPKINAWEAVRYVVPGIIAHKSALKSGQLMKVPDWGDAPTK